jgi:hypothetical protein
MDATHAPTQTGGLFTGWACFLNRCRYWDILSAFWPACSGKQLAGEGLASLLGLPKMPVLFGLLTIFKVLAGASSIC